MPTGHTATRQRQRPAPGANDAPTGRLLDRAASVPELRSGFVRRPELALELAGARETPLTLVVAPPGYGKSALLAEWQQQDERPFVWLAPSQDAPRTHATSNRLPPRRAIEALAPLIQDACVQHPSFVLALDDAHLVHPAALRALVEVALQELPVGSTLAVASRTNPPLPLGRLRAHRLLQEVRAPQLAMSSAEAAALLRQAGVEPGVEDVQALVAHTEGWPAALYLAALALREDRQPLERFGGANHLLSEYLKDEVLAALPDELQRFAIRTSVLDELSGPICDAVLERRGSALVLRQLTGLSPLLAPLDPAHHSYRWHRLMREALRDELELTEPDLGAALRIRASDWYAGRGDTRRAIDQAAAAADVVRTGELLWQNILSYVTQGRHDLVRGWIDHFSPHQISEHAALALSAALAAVLSGDLGQARHWSLAAAAALERDGIGRRRGSLRTGLSVLQAIDAPDGVQRMGEIAVRAAEEEPKTSEWRAVCLLLSGVAVYLRGDRDRAELLLDEATRSSGNCTPGLTCLCLAQRAMIAIERDDWELTADLTDRAAMTIEEWSLERDPLSAIAFAAAAASRAHHGRIDEAKHDLRCGIDLLAVVDEELPWYGAEARILLAHASLWLADVVGARTLLAEASRLARKTPDAMIFSEWFDRAWAYMDTLAETSLGGPSSLTIAELRILRFLPSHRSFREIAAQLGVSANTVKTQAHAVYRKLGAASRSEAVAHALEAGLLGQ